MKPSDAVEFAALVRRLDVAFDKPSNNEKRDEYYQGLRDVPIELLRDAVSAHVRQGKYYPRIADLRNLVDDAQPEHKPKRPPPEAYAIDGEPTYVCTACEDTGWRFVTERTDKTAPVARRCECHKTNPAITHPHRYGYRDPEFHRAG